MAALNRLSRPKETSLTAEVLVAMSLISTPQIGTQPTSTPSSGSNHLFRRGIVSVAIDESRCSETSEIGCVPFSLVRTICSGFSCRRCGSFIGIAYEESAGSKCKKYEIRDQCLFAAFE